MLPPGCALVGAALGALAAAVAGLPDTQVAHSLLRQCLGPAKVLHLLRAMPLGDTHDLDRAVTAEQKAAFSTIVGRPLPPEAWMQAGLPRDPPTARRASSSPRLRRTSALRATPNAPVWGSASRRWSLRRPPRCGQGAVEDRGGRVRHVGGGSTDTLAKVGAPPPRLGGGGDAGSCPSPIATRASRNGGRAKLVGRPGALGTLIGRCKERRCARLGGTHSGGGSDGSRVSKRAKTMRGRGRGADGGADVSILRPGRPQQRQQQVRP